MASLAQNTIAGIGVGISHELITLEITSPEVPDLTLIDLPGIARVAVGNQPQDIGLQVSIWNLAAGQAELGETSEASDGCPEGSGTSPQPSEWLGRRPG